MRSNSTYHFRHSPSARSWSTSPYLHSNPTRPASCAPRIERNHRPPFERSLSSPGGASSYNPPLPPNVIREELDGFSEGTLENSREESKPLLVSVECAVTEVYIRRWYLLLLFSMVALLQTMSWAMWGPISQSTEAVFSWGDSEIAMCVFMGNLSFVFCCMPFSWLMDIKGLRISMVLASLYVLAGSGLRCLVHFLPPSCAIWCVYGAQVINGMAGPVAQGAGALFSNLWFPNDQRATSTAISTFIGYAGSALAFVLGPFFVPSPSENANSNGTLPNGNNTNKALFLSVLTADENTTDYTNEDEMEDGLMSYLYYQALAAAVVFALVLAYFPDKPPRPPSLSAATQREDFKPGLIKLIRNKQFWLISLAFCLSFGVFEVWDVVLDVNLSAIGISQTEAGWLGFYSVIAGCLAGLVICRLGDIFFRQIRLFLIVAYVISAIFVLWFTLIYIDVLPFDMPSIYAAIILSGVFLDGCCPLVYELVCEAAYPVGEGVSSCFLQMLFELVGMGFTVVQEVPNIGTVWMNWCLLGTLCCAVPLLFFVNDTYGRAELDAVQQQVVVVNAPENPSTQKDHAKKEPCLLAPPAHQQTTAPL